MGLFSKIKEVFNKLIGKSQIETALKINTVISSEMDNAVNLWAQMYEDTPPWKSNIVQTLNLPAVISSKVAKMVTIESECTFEGGARAEYLQNIFKPVFDNSRTIAEQAIAKGGLIFKPYISNNQIIVDLIQADRFFPLSFDDNGIITSGVFVAQETQIRDIYTRLEIHRFENNTYTIEQRAYKSSLSGILGSEISLSYTPHWQNIEPIIVLNNVESPLFVYFKMPFANNIDETSPLGVSIYSKATDTIEQIDRQYSRLLWEFESGERAIHASADLFSRDKKGRPILPKGRERQYRLLNDGIEDGKNFFEDFSPAFRDTSILNGFNALLRQMEQQCGLAFGTFSNPNDTVKTATEILSSKQETYTTVSDIQKSLELALRKLINSIDVLATAGNLAPKGEYQVAFDWDDSIVNQPSERKKMFWQYVQAGKFPFWRYLVEFEGYTEDEAKAISSEQSAGDPYAYA